MSGRFLKDIGTLVSGNVVAQAVSLLAYLLLTRIYPPEDFGVFNIFFSYIEVLVILSTCKYEMSIVVADDDREAWSVAQYTLRLNALVSLALLAVVTALWLFNALPGKSDALGWLALLIPVLVFFMGSSRVYSGVCNRHRRSRPQGHPGTCRTPPLGPPHRHRAGQDGRQHQLPTDDAPSRHALHKP